MSEIKIVEKIAAPHTSWTTVCKELPVQDMCAIKVTFDRKYPYFWVASEYAYIYQMGLALTMADVERAAIFYEATGELTGFDVFVDGVFPLRQSRMARCIAMGPRKSFYILPQFRSDTVEVSEPILVISAQDDSVCPFAGTKGPLAS